MFTSGMANRGYQQLVISRIRYLMGGISDIQTYIDHIQIHQYYSTVPFSIFLYLNAQLRMHKKQRTQM